MNINKTNVEKFGAEFDTMISILAKKYGLVVGRRSIRYTDSGMKISVKTNNIDASGEKIVNKYHEDVAKFILGSKFGKDAVKDGVIGHQWKLLNNEVIVIVITDWNTRNSKYPVIYTKNGKSYKGIADFIIGRA